MHLRTEAGRRLHDAGTHYRGRERWLAAVAEALVERGAGLSVEATPESKSKSSPRHDIELVRAAPRRIPQDSFAGGCKFGI